MHCGVSGFFCIVFNWYLVIAYIFLSWPGLTESEMKSAGADDYNAAMRILMCGRREPAAFA